MKNNKKHGFTIVELVIVIAVIAILSAILIPTFVNLVKKAKMSADQQTITNMNLCLYTEQVENGDKKPETLEEVGEILKKSGYSLPLKPSGDGYEYYWIKEENKIVLVEMNDDGLPSKLVFPEEIARKYDSSLPADEAWYCLSSGTASEECTHDGGRRYEALVDDDSESSTYHNVICEKCNVVLNKEEHDELNEGACSKCGYKPSIPAENFSEYAVWVYTEGFSISNQGEKYGSLTISGHPKYGLNTIKEVLDNKDIMPGCVVKLNNDLTESVTLNKSIILDLNGHTLNGAGNGAVITFDSFSSQAIELSLFDTNPSATGKITGGNNISYPGSGGGIYVVNGTLNMYSGVISGNLALTGGGVGVETSLSKPATFNMYGGQISENQFKSSGGGVYIKGESSSFTMVSGEITKNTAADDAYGTNQGGGITVEGSKDNLANVTITGGEISENSAKSGAGLYVKYSIATILGNTIIKNNTSSAEGGGIYVCDSTMTLKYVTISGNSAISTGTGGRGGGVYSTSSTLIIDNGAKIIDNTVNGVNGNTYDSPTASGAGIFWYSSKQDYKLYLMGGEIKNNQILAGTLGNNPSSGRAGQGKLGAGVACMGVGSSSLYYPSIYVSNNCLISNNSGATTNKGQQIYTYKIVVNVTSDTTYTQSTTNDFSWDTSSFKSEWDGIVPEE